MHLVWLITYTGCFQAWSQNKKYFSFKHMVIAVKTICAKTCYQGRLSDKNICSVIFVVGNIYHIYHNKIFSFKMKLQNQLPLPFCWGWQPSVSNFEKGGCKRFAVQTLLWLLEFVIQIIFEHGTTAELTCVCRLFWNKYKCYCQTCSKYLNYQGFLSAWGDLVSFQCLGGQEIAGLWFARGGGQYPGWHYGNSLL